MSTEPLNLKEIAEKAANREINIPEEPVEQTPVVEEDDSIVIGDSFTTPKPEQQMRGPEMAPRTPVAMEDLNEADFSTVAPVPMDNPYADLAPADQVKYDQYKRDLILNGLTPMEAQQAMINKIKKDYNLQTDDTLKELVKEAEEISGEVYKPEEVGVIEIDKKQKVADLGLTEEEHEKLQKVKAIKLIVVEDEDLKTIQLDKYDTKYKSDYVKSVEGSLAKYSLPLPIYGDFITLRGAQILQLISACTYEDEKMEESISKKASLIYEKIISGSVLRKFDNDGKIKLSYNDFINTFPYQDLDLALYGILVASNMEYANTELTCDECKQPFDYRYNIKQLLDLNDIPDHFKEKFDYILGHKSNPEALQTVHDQMAKVRRYKSPFTNNIYDLSYPTIGRAINIFRRIDQTDSVLMYISALALYINKIYVYNPQTDKYIDIDETEVNLLLDSLMSIPDDDYRLLSNQLSQELVYAPKWTLKATCPHCGHEIVVNFDINNLVFWKAQDSLKEIR